MRILLTGGTGFFGKALLRHWLDMAESPARPAHVTIVTRNPERFLAQCPEFAGAAWLVFHRGDILSPETLPQHGKFSHLLHAATDSTLGPQLTPLKRFEQIVDGTRHMLDYAVAHGIRRFLLTSSGGVYGPQPQDLEGIPESYNCMPDPLNAQHAYSVAKRCAEHLCALYQDAHGIEPVIARCFAFVGRDLPLDVHFAIGNFIRDALQGSEIVVSGDGTPVRSYLDQRDLAVWLLAMLQRGQPGRAYNLGSDEEISIAELAQLVRDVVSPGQAVRILGKPSASNIRNRYVPDVTRARTELGLDVTVGLAEAIREAARSHANA